MKRKILASVALCCATLAHAGWFGIDFETTKTLPPKGSEDAVLYMTSNSFTQDEQYLVFGRRVFKGTEPSGKPIGSHRLYRRNMATGEELAITPDKAILSGLSGIVGGNSAFIVGSTAPQSIYEVDVINPGEPKKIWTLPASVRGDTRYKIYPLGATRDGNKVLVAFQDNIPAPPSEKHNDWQDSFLKSGAHAYLYLGTRTTAGWEFKKLLEQEDISKGWIGHAQLNPDTGKDVYYELDGPGKIVEQRGWLLDIETSKISKVYPEENADVHTSHGNYVKDGLIQIQEFTRSGCDVILFHTKTGATERFSAGSHSHLQTYEKDGMYYVIGDGSAMKQQASNMRRYVFKNGKVVNSTDVAPHGGNATWNEYFRYGRFSPSGKWFVFGSSSKIGEGEVVIVKDPLKLD